MSGERIFTVREITRYLKALLLQDDALRAASVQGEIADLVCHRSGHVYFTLKDEFAQLRCVLFREEAEAQSFAPRNGARVLARGTVTIYEARGQYQLIVRELEEAGVGDLFLAFERLKRKLAAEGLFDDARKRPLPPFPRGIAVLTSPVGAAMHDVLTTLRARWPAANVVLLPIAVSGPGAAPEIARSLEALRHLESVEVALLVRGGGSVEELAGFSDEAVARAIAASPVPVVTGIGHETDFTIADFVADRRAPTPTGAAVAATPDRRALLRQVQDFRRGLADLLKRLVSRSRRELALLRARPALCRPREVTAERRQRLDDLLASQRRSFAHLLKESRDRLGRAEERLRALSPEAVLSRGYAIMRLADGSVVRSARQVNAGTLAEVVLSEGSAEVAVQRTTLPLEG